MLAGLIGVAVGIFTIVVARLIHGQRWLFALGLLTLPSLYAAFALHAGEPAVGGTEMLYGVPFVVAGLYFAMVSAGHSALVVGAFWLLHALYDLTHPRFFVNIGVPDWYPVFCFSVDAVVGAYLLWLSQRIPQGNLRRA